MFFFHLFRLASIGSARGIARDELRGGLVRLLARRGTEQINRIAGATRYGADWPDCWRGGGERGR
ncbi:hypothetical protein MKX70_15380 [Paenibacillus sp. FSL R7-0312]|uniref:hypothetical protein n=1 Tax=unclassified Paenibacillus TaxID=185978 RepID=UPI0004F6CF1E|nr:hypothetical protein R50912_24100 [Paenibacillus sp. FSL R5-0912]